MEALHGGRTCDVGTRNAWSPAIGVGMDRCSWLAPKERPAEALRPRGGIQ